MQSSKALGRKIKERLILAEAAVCLVSARILLAIMPFERLMSVVSRPARQPEASGAERVRKRKEVRRAIFIMRGRLPNQATCLHRAITAQVMLRRRGLSTTLYFGAAKLPGRGLTTHAWVQDGEEGVVGTRIAKRDRYQVVATFPRQVSFSSTSQKGAKP